MNLNVLKPMQAIDSAFEKPNVALALILVLVAGIIAAVTPLTFGLQIDLAASALAIIGYYIGFILLAVLVYVAAFILKGKEAVSGKIPGIISGLGLMMIPVIVSLIVVIVVVQMILPPFAVSLAQDLQTGAVAVEDIPTWVNHLYDQNIDSINFTGFYALSGLLVLIGLFNVYLLYRIINKLIGYRLIPTLIIIFAIMVIVNVLQGLLPI
tara:strand:+ start:8666 stop:9295 length:630 start_codon:yes stop_codon:yes gene_type:complete